MGDNGADDSEYKQKFYKKKSSKAMTECGAGPRDQNNCKDYAPGNNGAKYQIQMSEPLPTPRGPATCPYEKALLQSMRLQGIMMQQMKDEIMKNRKVFKVFLRPTARLRGDIADRKSCSGDVDMVEELMNELNDDLEKVKTEFQKVQDEKREAEMAEENKSKCNCGLPR